MNSVMASPALQTSVDILDRVLTTSSGLVALDTADAQVFISQMRTVSRSTGQAMYIWQPGSGLTSLRDAHAQVPDCVRLGNALRYMQQSMHFGIYFLIGLELPLSTMSAALLRQLARAPKDHLRRVVLLDAPAALLEYVGELAVRMTDGYRPPRHLRLRDGRWLV